MDDVVYLLLILVLTLAITLAVLIWGRAPVRVGATDQPAAAPPQREDLRRAS